MTTIIWTATRTALAAHMKRAGLSQRKLAQASGVSQATLSEFLSGTTEAITVNNLAALARALEVTVSELLGEAQPSGALVKEGEPDGDIVYLTRDEIVESLRNPRRSMDEAALAELADSIEQVGVLQNLVVGPPGDTPDSAGVHPIIAGARRWKAVGKLMLEGRQINVNGAGVPAADYRLPCRVVEGDMVTVMSLALIENLQREDPSPMDEAEAFAWLRKEADWSTADIAARIGRTQRFVQRRLALVDKLDDTVKEAVREGAVTFIQAEAIALAPKAEQADWVDSVKDEYEDWTADQIRREVLGEAHPVKDAFFDLAEYDGAIVEGDPDDPEDRYFADTAQFLKLQRAAAAAARDALQAEWAWAELFDARKGQHFYSYRYDGSKDKTKAGAVVEIDYHHRVEVHTGLVAPPAAKQAGKAAAPGAAKPKRHFTDTHLRLARRVKTAVLQDAVQADPGAALRLCVLGLLGSPVVRVQQGPGDSNGNGAYGPRVLVESRERFLDLGGKEGDAGERYDTAPRQADPPLSGYNQDLDPLAVWRQLREMSDDEVLSQLATIVAAQTGTWNEWQGELGDDPVAAAIAADLGVDMTEAAQAQLRDADYLKSAGKQHVMEILADITAEPVPESLTAGKIRTRIADCLDAGLEDAQIYIPRELRWGRDCILPDDPSAEASAEAERPGPKNDPQKAKAALADWTQEKRGDTAGDDGDDDDAIDTLHSDEDVGPALNAAAGDPAMPDFLRRA